jgi:branched-chain amino acid transport system permease protein
VLVQTFGIAVVLTEALNHAFGTSERVLRVDLGDLPPALDLGTFVPTLDLIVFAIALVSAALLFLLLQKSEFGRAVRACRDSRRNAELVGIDANRIYMLTMAVCGVWAGLAGSLLVMLTPTAAYMHFHWTVDAFLVVVIGGMGSMVGALVGGFIYGILNFSAYYIYPTLAPAIIFGALILVLIVRPQGLFSLGTLARK